MEPRLIYKGAEAEILLEEWFGRPTIRKHRIPKAYRIPELDDGIRRMRTSHEAIMMHEVRRLGVPVPTIRHIDLDSSTIMMDFVNGPTLKDELYRIPMHAKRERCNSLGKILGKMHEGAIVHGDMTISNVLSEQGKLFMIDFGLGDFSKEAEDRGVDLLLLSRAMKSTHYAFYTLLFSAFMKGYASVLGQRQGKEMLRKMHEIEQRGRYFERA